MCTMEERISTEGTIKVRVRSIAHFSFGDEGFWKTYQTKIVRGCFQMVLSVLLDFQRRLNTQLKVESDSPKISRPVFPFETQSLKTCSPIAHLYSPKFSSVLKFLLFLSSPVGSEILLECKLVPFLSITLKTMDEIYANIYLFSLAY